MGIFTTSRQQNEIRKAVNAIGSSIIIYGEGWAAGGTTVSGDSLAMKANTLRCPVLLLSDELRDALRGPFNDKLRWLSRRNFGEKKALNSEIVGAIQHPQVNNDSVNYSKAPWLPS